MERSIASETAPGACQLVARLVTADGTAAHGWPMRLAAGGTSRRDLADAVHALGMLHGQHPGIADEARERGVQPDAGAWLGAIADGFASERAALATLVAAAGPLPSTPGHAESEAAILTQRHALDMLARSDRRGCASGAVAALALDWAGVRLVLDSAAEAFGVVPAPVALPDPAVTGAAIAHLSGDPASERAIGFGAQQLLAQHRGLWSLLEARAEARG